MIIGWSFLKYSVITLEECPKRLNDSESFDLKIPVETRK